MGKGKETVRRRVAEVYLFFMLVIYPLFVRNGYDDLIYRKWDMFFFGSLFFVVFGSICKAADIVGRKTLGRPSGYTVTDGFVFLYFLCTLISYSGAVDKHTGLWGVDTWYMGLISQLLLLGIYAGISGAYERNAYLKVAASAAAVLVSGMVILQRFGVDVLHLYAGYGEAVKLNFVTTLGQVTWASGYISILLVTGMGFYYLSENRREKVFWGICMGIGFATEAVLNCDSGMIAVCGAFMLLLFLAIGHRNRVLNLLEIVITALLAVAVIGRLEGIFRDKMILIDEIYLRTAQSRGIYILLGIVVILYGWLRKGKCRVIFERKAALILRGVYLALVCIGMAGVSLLFVLHAKGYFNGSPTENYFRFTVWWGNSRGFIWRTGAAVFKDFSLWRKLFGCGPDCFTPYAYSLMGDAINEFWHNQIVPNVHNEWFNGIINYGIIGGTAYLGIFVSGAYAFMKAGLKKGDNVIFGIGLAAVGYIFHNILCYQQIIGTPLIFILLGIGAACNKRNKN